MMEAVGEAQVFAEKTGLGTGPMEELIGEAFGPVAGGYSKRYVRKLMLSATGFSSPTMQIDYWCICPIPGLSSWIRRVVGYQGC